VAHLILLNNYMHDFGAALWLSGTIVLWHLWRLYHSHPGARPALEKLLSVVSRLMAVGFIGILVCGIIRAIAYRQFEWNPDAGDGQVKLLIVKHLILLVVFIPGVMLLFRCRALTHRKENP